MLPIVSPERFLEYGFVPQSCCMAKTPSQYALRRHKKSRGLIYRPLLSINLACSIEQLSVEVSPFVAPCPSSLVADTNKALLVTGVIACAFVLL